MLFTQAATKKQKYEKISEKKMSTPVEVLCKVRETSTSNDPFKAVYFFFCMIKLREKHHIKHTKRFVKVQDLQ